MGDAGYAVYAISIPWLAYGIGGPFALGLALFAEFGVFSLSFATGPFLDGVDDLRRVLWAGYAGQGALAALLGILAYDGLLTVPTLLAVVVPISALWDFTWTASNAVPPRTIPPGELLRANGLLGAVSGGNQIAGYALGAGLVYFVGPSGGLFLYAALNGVAALLAVPIRAPRSPGRVPGFGGAFREGWEYFLGGPGRPRLQISLASATQAFVSVAPVLLLTVLAANGGGGSSGYARTFTAFALGGIVGGLVLGQLAPRRGLGRWLGAFATAEAGLLVAAVWGASVLPISLLGWAGIGVADGGFFTVLLSYFQATSPPALVARTVSNAYLFRGLSRAFGGLALAILIGTLAVLPFALLVAAVLLLVGIGGPVALPAVRRMGL